MAFGSGEPTLVQVDAHVDRLDFLAHVRPAYPEQVPAIEFRHRDDKFRLLHLLAEDPEIRLFFIQPLGMGCEAVRDAGEPSDLFKYIGGSRRQMGVQMLDAR